MKKRVFKAFVFILALTVFVLLPACSDDRGDVVSLAFVEGSFKETYVMDEALDLTSAYILVTYENGSVERVQVTESMVSGFSSAVQTASGRLTVTYGGQSIIWMYRVTGTGNVQTPFRLSISATDAAGVYEIAAGGVDMVSPGVYAFAFDISVGTGMSLGGECLLLAEGFSFTSRLSEDGRNLGIVMWSADGATPLAGNGAVCSFTVSGTGSVTIQNASVSDGTADYTVPQHTYTIA